MWIAEHSNSPEDVERTDRVGQAFATRLALDPSDAWALNERVSALRAKRAYVEAIEDLSLANFDAALRLVPRRALLLSGRGLAKRRRATWPVGTRIWRPRRHSPRGSRW